MDVSGYLRAVDKAAVVAFDVFDTLVVRPFYRPRDLFSFLEEESGLAGFGGARVDAERDARKVDPEADIHLIYEHLALPFQPLKGREIESEISLTRADPEALKVFRYALERGKKVVAVSDMYLPSGYIGEILSRNGFSGYSKLYVSTETKRSKRSGAMYNHVSDDLGIPPAEILMIGDNVRADVAAADSKGLMTMRWVPLWERYAASNRREIRFAGRNRGYAPSVLVGMDMLGWAEHGEETYWHSVARRFGGPMNVAFARFIMDNSAGSDGLVFFSRDGYMPMVVYGILGGEKPYTYLHTSRMTAKVFGSRDLSDRDTVVSVMNYLRSSGRAGNLTIPQKSQCMKFAEENRELLEDILSDAHERYGRYLKSIMGDGKKLFIVDATTMKYTSQRDVERYLPDAEVRGCYYAITADGTPEHLAYRDRSKEFLSSSQVNIAEFFLGSGEKPLIDIADDGELVFKKETDPNEAVRDKVFPEILDGIKACARSYADMFGDRIPCIPGNVMDGWMKVLMAEERGNDPDTLSGIKWAVNTQHSIYIHLILRRTDVIRMVFMKAVWAALRVLRRIRP